MFSEKTYLFLEGNNDIPALLLNYCEMRICPKGILPIQERFADLKSRAPFAGIDEIAALSPKLESTIQALTTINLNDITDDNEYDIGLKAFTPASSNMINL